MDGLSVSSSGHSMVNVIILLPTNRTSKGFELKYTAKIREETPCSIDNGRVFEIFRAVDNPKHKLLLL
jgi:hypothetical protein